MTELVTFLLESLRQPKRSIMQVLAMRIDKPTAWFALITVTVASLAITAIFEQVLIGLKGGNLDGNVLMGSVVSVLGQVCLVLVMGAIARAFGGRASADRVALMMAWVQACLIIPGIVILAAIYLVPEMALLWLFSMVIVAGWLTVSGLAAVSGFEGWGKSLGIFLISSVLLSVILLIFASMMGFGPMLGTI